MASNLLTTLSEISLNTSGSTYLLIVSLLAAIGLSYFVYRNTIPPVPLGWRILLMSLRAAVVMIIILLLFEPILSITRRKQEKPVVAVLLDNSASMALNDQKVNRRIELKNTLNAEIFHSTSGNFNFVFYPYSHQLFDELDSVPDSMTLNGDGTDIRRALAELKERLAEKYFGAALLITDGADNLGENPARYAANYGVPIYPIAIGDPAEQKDVLISNYVTNEIAYAGTRVPVDVYVRSSGFSGQRVQVTLNHANQTLDTQIVQLSGNSFEQKVRLHFSPEKEGVFKYEVRIPEMAGELTKINNSKTFYIKILKSKLKLLIVAGSPGADFLFLKRALEADENFEVQSFVEKRRGRFYNNLMLPNPEQLAKFDCLILVDYPRRTSRTESLEKIKSALAKGKPLFVLSGKNTDYAKLLTLKDFIPLAAIPQKGPEQIIYMKQLPQGVHHPLLRLAEDDSENIKKWQELPPSFFNLNSVKLQNTAQSLAVLDMDRSGGFRRRALPLVVVRSSGKRKSAAVLTYGLWRWDLLMWGVGKNNSSYLTFLQNTIRWLTTDDDSKLVKIVANKEIYRSGEEVKFTAQVYFEDYQPVDGAEVTVQLQSAKGKQNLALSNAGQGRYEGRFQVLEGGDYEFTGTAHLQSRVLGRDSGKFSVEEFNLEYQNTRMNEDLLKRIASESGGEFFTSENFSGLKERLTFPDKFITLKNEWEIWNRLPLLITCILLLSAEWFIRKRKGML